MKDGQFCAAYDGAETYTCGPFDTREAAIEEFKGTENPAPGTKVSTGTIRIHRPSISATSIIDGLREQAMDDSGCELSENWLSDVTRIQEHALENAINNVLLDWLIQYHFHPDFGSIENVETTTI